MWWIVFPLYLPGIYVVGLADITWAAAVGFRWLWGWEEQNQWMNEAGKLHTSIYRPDFWLETDFSRLMYNNWAHMDEVLFDNHVDNGIVFCLFVMSQR